MFELPSQSCWSRGGDHALPPILADLLTLSQVTRGADYARLITTAPFPPPSDFQTLLRPCKLRYYRHGLIYEFWRVWIGHKLDLLRPLVLYFSTFLARVDLWSLWSDLLRSWLRAVLRMTLLCTLLVLIFCVFAVLDFKLTFSYRPQSNLKCT